MPDDVLEFIAIHVKDNIRELEGALTRQRLRPAQQGADLQAQAERVLSDIVLADEPRRITPQVILDATSLASASPSRTCAAPAGPGPWSRPVKSPCTFRDLTDFSYPAIGREFGDRDHTTVIHAVEKISGQMKERQQIYKQVTELIQQVRAGSA